MSLQDAMQLPIETQIRRWVIAVKRSPKVTIPNTHEAKKKGLHSAGTFRIAAISKAFIEWCNQDGLLQKLDHYPALIKEAEEYAKNGRKR